MTTVVLRLLAAWLLASPVLALVAGPVCGFNDRTSLSLNREPGDPVFADRTAS